MNASFLSIIVFLSCGQKVSTAKQPFKRVVNCCAGADYQDMNKRRKHKQLEFIWQGTGDADADGGIFTGNFASGNYGPPPGFWWEWSNSPDPPMIEDGPESNVEERVETFVQRCLEVANVTRGRDIMLTMG
jgi:hypothetical protein